MKGSGVVGLRNRGDFFGDGFRRLDEHAVTIAVVSDFLDIEDAEFLFVVEGGVGVD